MTELPSHVDIREVSLRDGLQIESPIPLSAKLRLLDAVAATGVREVEATAFVSPSKVPAMADAAEVAAEFHRYPGIEFSALVASPNGARRAVAAGLRAIEYVVSPSDTFSHANVGRSSTEATAQISEIVAIGHDSDATKSRSSSPPHGTVPTKGPPRRSASSTSSRLPADTAPTGSRSPTPSAPPSPAESPA